MLVLGGLAAFALLIAGSGLFGVLSHATVQRTPDIGVRIAMGAGPRAIVGLVMRQAGVLIGLGLAAGLGSALFAVEVLSSFVYGVTVRDTLSFKKIQVANLANFLERSGIPPSVWSTQLKAFQAKANLPDLRKLAEAIDEHLKR